MNLGQPLLCLVTGQAPTARNGWFLAQVQRPLRTQDVTTIFFWLAMLIGAVVLIVICGMIVRRIVSRSMRGDSAPPFSLADLRRLRDQGQLSPEEYERARALMIAQMPSSKPDASQVHRPMGAPPAAPADDHNPDSPGAEPPR